MTSQDTIRTVIEIVPDTFHCVGLGGLFVDMDVADTKFPYHIKAEIENLPQHMLDALAAAAVRVVDEMDGYKIDPREDGTAIYEFSNYHKDMFNPRGKHCIAFVSDKGRTENTLEAIAEFVNKHGELFDV